MSTPEKKAFLEAAAAAGYEHAYGEETLGEHFNAFHIFVKLSNRKLSDKDDFYEAADIIKKKIGTVTAELDPEGPAKREGYRKQIEDIFRRAGVDAIYMEPLPNGYCSNPCCLNKPWFRVTSEMGHIVIGWRKRVISINWKDTLIKQSGEELFPNEQVTRGKTYDEDSGRYMHAWGADAAFMYIKRLHETYAAQES